MFIKTSKHLIAIGDILHVESSENGVVLKFRNGTHVVLDAPDTHQFSYYWQHVAPVLTPQLLLDAQHMYEHREETEKTLSLLQGQRAQQVASLRREKAKVVSIAPTKDGGDA